MPGGRPDPALASRRRPRGRVELGWTVWADEAPLDADDGRRIRPRSARRPARRRGSTRPTERPPTTPGGRGMRAIESDNELFDLTSSQRSIADLRLLLNDGPTARRALSRRRRAVVRHAVRPRLDHRVAPGRSPSGPTRRRDARGPRRAPGDRGRRLARRRARQDPPRAPDRRDGADRRAALRAVLRQRRCDAALADPARRDVRLDRRPTRSSTGSGRTPSPRSNGSTDWGDRDGDGFVEYERRAPRGLAQPGLEGLGRRDPRTGRAPRPSRRSPWPRSRATSTTPSGGWRGSPRRAARRSSPIGSRREAAALSRGSTRRSGWPTRLLRDGPRRRQAAGRRDGLERRPVPLERDRRRGSRAAAVAERLIGPEHGLRLGRPDLRRRASPATTRSATTPGTVWPHDNALIAGRRCKRYGFDDGGGPAGRPDLRGRPALPGPPPARAVLRLRSARRRRPGRLPGRVLAAGLVGGVGAAARPDDARLLRARAPDRARARSGRTCRRGSAR